MNNFLTAAKKKAKKVKEKVSDLFDSLDSKTIWVYDVCLIIFILVLSLIGKRGDKKIEALANRLNFRMSLFGYPIKGHKLDLETMKKISKLNDSGMAEKDILKSLNLLDTDRYRW